MIVRTEESFSNMEFDLQLLAGLPVPAFSVNNEGRVLFWNQAMLQLTGRSADEMIGNDPRILFGDGKPLEIWDKVFLSKESQTLGSFEINNSQTGTIKEVCCTATPIWSEENELIGIWIVIEEKADRKSARMPIGFQGPTMSCSIPSTRCSML